MISGAAAVLVITGAVGAAIGSSHETPSYAAVDSYVPPAQTPNEHCAADVYNAAADMVNNGQSGFMREMAVGGVSNPVYQLATRVQVTFQSELYQKGRMAAEADAQSQAQQLCDSQGNPNNDTYGGTPYVAPVG